MDVEDELLYSFFESEEEDRKREGIGMCGNSTSAKGMFGWSVCSADEEFCWQIELNAKEEEEEDAANK